MATTIENPILNGPFEAPQRHWRFDEDGITSTIDELRRKSAYFMPIAQLKKKGAQRTFETEWTRARLSLDPEFLHERNAEYNAGLPRLAMKMATGSGKPSSCRC